MKIGGIDRPIKFGVNQTDLFCELRNISLKQYYELLSNFETGDYKFGEIRDLVWSALKDGARQAKTEFDLEPMDIGDLMDENPAEIISETMVALVGSLPKPSDNGGKKKVQAKTKN